MRSLLLTAALVVALGGLAFRAEAASAQRAADPEGVVRAVVAAFNARDAATAASFFAEEATATGLCRPANVCHGRAEIQGQLEKEIAEGAQDQIRDLTVNGDTVILHVSETAPGFAELAIDRTYITVMATVQHGLVTSLSDELDLTDPQTAKFAQALEQEQSGLPASGTGYTAGHSPGPFAVIALLAIGGALCVPAAGTLRRRRARSR